ncbi:hypothetical protein H0H93_014592 [Arthromyces matolae]|nr:hypothetical protein H0H93_014592 [Arthromyces matolae]
MDASKSPVPKEDVDAIEEFTPDDTEMFIDSTEYLEARNTTSSSGHYAMDYLGYVDLVLSGGIGIVQIYDDVFVVQGWNTTYRCESAVTAPKEG